uniref:Uncharacterized protein n=1 Tax=uncultured marine virus TaxID=186617 RepID=A0A0F7L8A4_9VIRU|nr:hypothetical protein [uncultured marine virus]
MPATGHQRRQPHHPDAGWDGAETARLWLQDHRPAGCSRAPAQRGFHGMEPERPEEATPARLRAQQLLQLLEIRPSLALPIASAAGMGSSSATNVRGPAMKRHGPPYTAQPPTLEPTT